MNIDERLIALKESVERHHREMQEARLQTKDTGTQINETDRRFEQLGNFVDEVEMACASQSLSIMSRYG